MDNLPAVGVTPLDRRRAAVSSLVHDVVAGPIRSARVISVFDRGLYLALDPLPEEREGRRLGRITGRLGHRGAPAGWHGLARIGRILPVVQPGALLLPSAVRLPTTEALVARLGQQVEVGEGRLRSADWEIEAVRQWRPRAVHVAAPLSQVMLADPSDQPRYLGHAMTPTLRGLAAELAYALTLGRTDRARRAAAGLVGLGPGLTPSGDDVICGLLLTLRGAGRTDLVTELADLLEPLLDRTSALSAALIACAVRGFAVPAVIDLVDLLAATGHAGDDRIAAVAVIGHTSGVDLLTGISAARTALACSTGSSPGTAVPARIAAMVTRSTPTRRTMTRRSSA